MAETESFQIRPTKVLVAPYACHADQSRGRLIPEPSSASRTAFQRDRDRIIHAGAFRRLKYKTQVFVFHEGDYYRTRLSHSLEVAQIARTIARALGFDEDLAEALALAHDLGHPPFGHAGEDALDECMAPFNGFDHNDQTVRVLTRLEQRYPEFRGLNLTWETLEGVAKHNGPLVGGDYVGEVPPTIAEIDKQWSLELSSFANGEAQIAALADDIAYNNHDVDDGLRAELFEFEDLAEQPMVSPVLESVQRDFPGLDKRTHIQELVRRLIGVMVTDVIRETSARLSDLKPDKPEDIRSAGRTMVAFSAEMEERNQALKSFLFERMYRHYKVNRMATKAKRVVTELFELFHDQPNTLPTRWQIAMNEQRIDSDPVERARRVADYIAGMTDRFALEEYNRLFDMDAKT